MIQLNWSLAGFLVIAGVVCGAEPQRITVDFAAAQGEVRALHGINKGPLAPNGLVNVIDAQKRLRVPFTRLHDCHFPNPDVVDVHTIFPNPEADPRLPASYDFRATDEYIAAVRTTGAEIIYRLGESIEHQTFKRHVHPPRDPGRWAAVCAGIIRHYNEGWANGFHYGIRYWEIWNEPENRPVMWTGNDAQFLELYRITVRLLKEQFPTIKIGGPGFGYYGKFDGKELQPSELCNAFLELCQREPVPLDFFSWHCYTDSPLELGARARAVRHLLDARGFTKTESHLNEWNLLPSNSWDILSRKAAPENRQRGLEAMLGAPGAAFLAAVLIELQNAPVDVSNFYHGETGIFGLFTEVGAPTRNYYGMLAFAQMLHTPKRMRAIGAMPGKTFALAGLNVEKTKAAVLVSNWSGSEEIQLRFERLPWQGATAIEVRLVGAEHAFEQVVLPMLAGSELPLKLSAPAVALVSLRPQAN